MLLYAEDDVVTGKYERLSLLSHKKHGFSITLTTASKLCSGDEMMGRISELSGNTQNWFQSLKGFTRKGRKKLMQPVL